MMTMQLHSTVFFKGNDTHEYPLKNKITIMHMLNIHHGFPESILYLQLKRFRLFISQRFWHCCI